MKKKKLAISLLVTMIIGICFFTGNILAAAKPELSIKPTANDVEVGGTVTYDVVLKNCDSFGGAQFEVVMPEGLKATSAAIVVGKGDLGDNLMTKASVLSSGNVKIVIGLADGRAITSLKLATFTCEAIASGEQKIDVCCLKMSDGCNKPLDPKFSKDDSVIKVVEPVIPCEHKNTEIRNAVKATCEKDGYTGDTYCLDCEKTIAKGKVIKALGHDFDEGIVTVEPGCETEGVKVLTCQRCGATKSVKIKALGHIDENKDNICDRCQAKMPVNPVNPKEDNTPVTGVDGDTSMILLAGLLVAALCVGGAFILRKKYTK